MARAGLTDEPIVPPPPALRPYLAFAKQTPRSLEAIARVIDRDDDFRARVAAGVDEAEVGRAGWLWLTRPDGWRAELDELVARSAARQADEQEAKAERSAQKRLAAAQAAASRAEAEAAARAAELDELRHALAAERERRSRAESQVEELERMIAALTEARSDAVRQLKRVEARLVERSTEVNAMKARLREAESAAGRRSDSGVAATAARPAGGAGAGAAVAAPEASPDRSAPLPAAGPPGGRPAPGAGAWPPAPRATADVAAELERTAEAAAMLADGLAGLARRLGAGPDADLGLAGAAPQPSAGLFPDGGLAGGPVGADAAAPVGATEPAPGQRVPLTLPGGMFDDSAQAAEYLLRVPGVVLVVDGYNVSMTAWPELTAGEQRRRLVSALEDLAARTSTPTEVVFDGAEVDAVWVGGPGRRLVRVRFSSPDIEADDVVIDIVGHLPGATPVVVASSDNRVRDDARRVGANVLHARQLVALLRR